MRNMYPVCNECKGYRLLFDAYVAWSRRMQQYEITMVADKPVKCEDCDHDVSVTWVSTNYDDKA